MEQKYRSKDSDYGLPENQSFNPIDRNKPTEQTSQKQTPKATTKTTKKDNSNGGIIALVVILLLVAAGFVIYFFLIKPQNEADKIAAAEKRRQQELADQKLKAEQEKQRELEAERHRALDSARLAQENIPEEGTISVLKSRTGRSYVVIGSFFDKDQAMDLAGKRKEQGLTTFVIEPYGKTRFYRVAAESYETYDEGMQGSESYKSEYGSEVWVLKY
ncbi:hypothetical protein [Marinigracilibium pacificum]|uniref:SPOR domain-containing protein n=1 Tax=Marinigracilibium pacificum TaxID=2729599 RepID=A0A848IVQ5_9BACT|nr:hypothetical protein [Marinigracilibium pacificum]NMM48407.1 hypothetical protein [Marinigracilibium pacificum]